MQTKCLSKEEAHKQRSWLLVDANGQTLGRLASKVATLLRGKHKAVFAPHVDTGDFVIVVNAEKVRLTGNKLESKIYYHHTGHIGGLVGETAEKLLARNPTRIIEKAVQGMLPSGPLGFAMVKKLKVYAGTEHPHSAQKPQVFQMNY